MHGCEGWKEKIQLQGPIRGRWGVKWDNNEVEYVHERHVRTRTCGDFCSGHPLDGTFRMGMGIRGN